MFQSADGAAWAIAAVGDTGVREFYRIATDGTVTCVAKTDQLQWRERHLARDRTALLNASDGSIWLAMPAAGVARRLPVGGVSAGV